MNADTIAPWYRWIEYAAFGRSLEHHRFLFLDRLANAQKILVMGEGDGRTLAQLVYIAPDAQIDVVESSAGMIQLARRRVSSNAKVCFRQLDAGSSDLWAVASAKVDGIVTSFFLDCFDEASARQIVGRLAQALEPGGLWLMNDFSIPPSGWRRWHARAWIGVMYRFFRLTTHLRANKLPPIDVILNDAGLRLIESRTSFGAMIVSQVWRKP